MRDYTSPIGGGGSGPIGGGGSGPIGGGGSGPIGGGHGCVSVYQQIAWQYCELGRLLNALACSPCCAPNPSCQGGVDFVPQIRFVQEEQRADFLCWIAVAVSVKRHFEKASRIGQCGLIRAMPEQAFHSAAQIPAPGSCCTQAGGVRKECDRPGRLEEALKYVHHLAPDVHVPNPSVGPMAFEDIQDQIDSGHPVCAFIAWTQQPGDGHFIVISGYNLAGGIRYLYVNDPLGYDGPQPYDRVVSDYNLQGGTWANSYRLKG